MTSNWEREFGITKTIVVAIYLAMVVYAFFIFSGIPYVEPQWGETQNLVFYVLLFEAVGIFVISIFLPNVFLNSEKLAEKFRSAGDKAQGLRLVMSHVRIWAIILAALGEACAVNGLVLYLISGDVTRPWIFFIITIAHYTTIMGKLRRVREDIGHLSQL